MSQKSTARTGSEGDVEFNEIKNSNAISPLSSCRSKKDLLGGPFGDSPFDRAQDNYQDYLVIMFHNKDESPTSESSQGENDLYNIQYNYTDQLNLVRRTFNLVEFPDEDYEGCKITEIIDEQKKPDGNTPKEKTPGPQKLFAHASWHKGYELTTIHPFSLNYNLESGSSTNIFESDYSPPSKKVCQRLKTPRFASVSEGSVAYHTKVGIHDATFKANAVQGREENLMKFAAQFTETRQTQCNEEEFTTGNVTQRDEQESNTSHGEEKIFPLDLSYDTDSQFDSPKSGPLFPNIIIDSKRTEIDEESSLSSRTTKQLTTSSSVNKDTYRKSSKEDVLSLNSIRGSSDEDEHDVPMTNTTVDAVGEKKKRKSLMKKAKGPLEGLTMWEEITRMRVGSEEREVEKSGHGDVGKSGDLNDFSKLNSYVGQLSENIKLGEFLSKESENSRSDGKTKLNQYIKQYIQYKTEVEKVRISSSKKNNKHTIIGQRLVNIDNRIMDSPDNLYQSENSLVSDEDKCTKSAVEDSGESEPKTSFWERFCSCMCLRRNVDD